MWQLAHTTASWSTLVHERDILLPLGLTPTEVADETVASLRYAADARMSLMGLNSLRSAAVAA